ncbi:MAG: hemagglutinin-related autotransporter protein, partial [Pseudomonas sp.]|nr:hemagglutinin-related autotransporter protein [Pseudomonas sp.]
MPAFQHHPSRKPGPLTVLAIAIASALTAGQAYAINPYGIHNDSPISSLDNPLGTTLSGALGIYNTSSIGTLTNSGSIHGGSVGISNGSSSGSNTGISIGTLTNSGSIVGGNDGILNVGTIDTLNNSGTIHGDDKGILNYGTITSLNNATDGTISGDNYGIYTTGHIDTLSNSGAINAGSSSGSGIYNNGSIGTLSNSGTISGAYGIGNEGSIDTLTNTGTISGSITGIYNYGSIGALNNSGTISGGRSSGIFNPGSIGTLTNSGTLSGRNGIWNGGSIGSIGGLNNSGLITGSSYAIYNESGATLGTVTNSGTIAGSIKNYATQDLTINGGTGSTFGILTGSSSGTGVGSDNIGNIYNYRSNVVFGSGNQLLNDNIIVSGDSTFTVSNLAATLQVNNTIAITGNYQQGANASLILGVASNAVTTGDAATDSGYGRLVVSGSANIDSGSTV